jgi:hypothetical protein
MSKNSIKDLSTVVRRTLKDLAIVRRTLLEISEETPDDMASCEVLNLELAGELKSVVDGLRLLLWAYVRALSAKSGRSPGEVLELYKMQLAVEMLRNVRGRHTAPPQGFISDFEQLVNQTLAATPPKNRIQ